MITIETVNENIEKSVSFEILSNRNFRENKINLNVDNFRFSVNKFTMTQYVRKFLSNN